MIAGVGAGLAWALVTTRYRRLALLAAGFVGRPVSASLWVSSSTSWWTSRSVGPPPPLFLPSDSAAGRTSSDPATRSWPARSPCWPSASFLRNAIVRRLGLLLALYAAISVLAAAVPALSPVADVGSGIFVASALLLLFGRNDLSPDRPIDHRSARRESPGPEGILLGPLEVRPS